MVAIVGTLSDGSSRSVNEVAIGTGYDGVVSVSTGSGVGTGTLLFGGRAVLTAAHLFDRRTKASEVSVSVYAESTVGADGRGTPLDISASAFEVHPLYDPANINYDLAIIWLAQAAPVDAPRYQLYRDSNEVSDTLDFDLVGFGQPGTGETGVSEADSEILRQIASNTFEDDFSLVTQTMSAWLGWDPLVGSLLVADFDYANALDPSAYDAFGRLFYQYDPLGLGDDEGLITPGDSGGPAFVNPSYSGAPQVAGIASYGMNLYRNFTQPDISPDTLDSSYGELAAWTRVSYHQQWIDETLQSLYPDAPQSRQEVITRVVEGDSGTTLVYFFVEFLGVRDNPNAILSVDYRTKVDSQGANPATPGVDFLPVSGTLKLYPEQNYAVIPVEVIGDTDKETDETFLLEIYNPVGGSFGEGVTSLTASRTIISDDLFGNSLV